MNEERYDELKRSVNYINEEGLMGLNKEVKIFRNADELIDAIRNNETPIKWTEEDEAKWQASMAIDSVFNEEEVNTCTDEFNEPFVNEVCDEQFEEEYIYEDGFFRWIHPDSPEWDEV